MVLPANDNSDNAGGETPSTVSGKDYGAVLESSGQQRAAGSGDVVDVLQSQGLVTSDQANMLRSESQRLGKPLEDVILDMHFVTDEALAQVKSRQFGIPFIDLGKITVPKEVLDIIPLDAAQNYGFVVFEREGSKLKIAMTDPQNFQALEALDFIIKKENYQSEIYITTKSGLENVLSQYGGVKEQVGEALAGATIELEKTAGELKNIRGGKELERFVEKAPVSKAVDVIIQNAVAQRASDVHIEPTDENVRVRFRIDGILYSVLTLSKQVHAAIVSRIKIISNLKIDETRIPQDGRFHLKLEGREIDFRVSTLPTINGEKVVLRILDRSEGIFQMEKLGILKPHLQKIESIIKKTHGMFLVTGPTGAGKSTTLYSVLGILNEPSVNIITLEDPVEYFVEGVSQSQINPGIGLTFASGLRSILRQDPDIIMVGEIRDQETAEMAVHAALTGHIVLSTLHTNSSFGSIPRLIDMGIEPFLLASALNAVLAQRLVRQLCPKCRQKRKATPDEVAVIMKEWGAIPPELRRELKLTLSSPLEIYEPKGCPECKDGYKGRIGIFEFFEVDNDIQDAILQQSTATKIKSVARKSGTITMMEDGVLKILKGLTTVEEVLRATRD
jgi:type IV pilus assembly protein PilB